MLCPECRIENRGDAGFCRSCGARLAVVNQRKRRRHIPSIRIIVVCLLIGGLATLVVTARFSPLRQGLAALIGGSLAPTTITAESLVQGIQGMSQLATAKYTIQTIVAVESRSRFGPLTKDRILLRANADVFAGIDLGAIRPEHVEVEGELVIITLPAPTLISSDITYQVYDRDRGLFAPTNKDLQSLAEQQARADITNTACEKGILEEAQRNSETALRSFIMSMGFEDVRFVTTQPSVVECGK